MSVEWSPDDTKAQLLAVCKELGIEANMGMLKSEIITLLDDASEPDDDEADDVVTSAVTREDAYRTDASFSGEPKPPIPDPPKPPPPKPPKGVVGLLRSSKEPVSLIDLRKKLGQAGINEVKQLVAQGKVCQHRKGNRFWFSLN